MATALGRFLVGTQYRDVLGTDDPAGRPQLGDYVVAGPGNDYLIGDIGADVFGFNPGDGLDWIDAFTPGEDKLQFGGGLTAASLTIRQETLNGIAGLSIYYPTPSGPSSVFVAGVSALRPGDIEFGELPGKFFDPPAQDFDTDSRSDVLLRGGDGAVKMWMMNGASIASAPVVANPGTGWTSVATGDFNDDWKVDLLFQAQDGSLAVWAMNGASIFKSVFLPNPGAQWHVAGSGHFDDDAVADILFRADDGGIAIWRMGGVWDETGTVKQDTADFVIQEARILGNPGTAWSIAGTGDLNGDTRSDILFRHADGTLVAWRMDGTSIIGGGSALGTLAAGQAVAGVADFNGDRKADILVRAADGALSVWTTDGTTPATKADIANPGAGYAVVGTGDYNGDGKADILLQAADGTVMEWQMNGATVAAQANVGPVGADWQIIV